MRLTLLLDMAVNGFGDRPIVGRLAEAMTAAELDARARSGAALIQERDADAVLYLALNGPAFPVALLAAAHAGVPLVPVNYRLGEQQLAALLAKHPHAIGISDPQCAKFLDAAGIAGMTPEEWLATTTVARGEVPDATDDGPAVVIYTSGTTSEPKGVLLRHANLVSYVLGSVEFASADEGQAALVAVPPYHIAAVANVITNLYAGRRTVTLEAFTPEQWLDTVREEGITNALVVPTMLARIVGCAADKSVPTLRGLAYGGAPMPARLIEQALTMWPEVGFVNAYGLTETSSTVTVLGPDDHRSAVAATDPAARAIVIGRQSAARCRARNLATRLAVLPAGATRPHLGRGEQVSAEYAGIGRLVDPSGFFDTRDDGYLDEDGYLFVGGRADDTIIRGAENIAPAEIEDVLLRHPAVEDVAVVGIPDDVWGQQIGAVVVARAGGVDAEELREFAKASLRSSKTPDQIWFWDELPRTETGKLIRRNVLAQVLAEEPKPRSQ